MTSPYGSQYPGEQGPVDPNHYPHSQQLYGAQFPGYGQGYGRGYGQENDAAPVQPMMGHVQWRAFDVGTVFGQAWKAFTATWQTWILATVVYYIISFVLSFLWMIPVFGFLVSASPESSDASMFLGLSGFGLLGVLLFIATVLVGIAWNLNAYRNAAKVARGEQISIGSFFRLSGLGKPFLVYLFMCIIVGIGMVLFVIPGIIALFLLIFAMPAAFQISQVGAGQALSASVKAVRNNIGATIVLLLVCLLLSFVGGALIIGVVVTMPLVFLLGAYAFQNAMGAPSYNYR